MPGYLDLPLQPGHTLTVSETSDVALASFRHGDGDAVEKAYTEALTAMGWAEYKPRELMKVEDDQARCIALQQLAVVAADGPPSKSGFWIRFDKRRCPD